MGQKFTVLSVGWDDPLILLTSVQMVFLLLIEPFCNCLTRWVACLSHKSTDGDSDQSNFGCLSGDPRHLERQPSQVKTIFLHSRKTWRHEENRTLRDTWNHWWQQNQQFFVTPLVKMRQQTQISFKIKVDSHIARQWFRNKISDKAFTVSYLVT